MKIENQNDVIGIIFLNDKYLKELYKILAEIYHKSIPVIIKISPTKFMTSYSDEVNKLIDEIEMAIDFRKKQIINAYQNKQTDC
jgi:vacuolar-type H+-ATPase subunit F/Vma7